MLTTLLLATLSFGPFDRTDAILESSYVAMEVTDALQTRWALDHGSLETNPLFGSHPSIAKQFSLTLGVIALQSAVAWVLPDFWRKAFLGASIGMELTAIHLNYYTANGFHLSLGVNF